jgi:type I restriction enzyme, S subunit
VSRAYPEYRDCGEPWIGKVPCHWHDMALKRLVALRSGTGITSEEIEDEGLYPVYGGNGRRGYAERYTHEGGYVLIGRQGALCGNVNYATGRFWASEHALVATPRCPVALRWLGELLRTMNLNQYSTSAAQPGLAADALGELRVVVPPLPEQKAIAAFLERETGKIDALVAEQRRLIELLKEKRQAVISHAVTKGLDPAAPMKPSGIDWLGDVPAHWEVVSIKWLSPVLRGASPRPIDDPRYFDENGEYAWVRIADVSASDGLLTETAQVLSELGSSLSVRLEPGALFVSIAGSVGKPCITRIKACIHDGFVYFPRLQVDSNFLYRIFEAGQCYRGLGKLGTQLNLNTDTIGSIRVAVPPPHELQLIRSYIDEETKRLDALVSQAEEGIVLLNERRSALISAAVTGKIDVRGLVSEATEAA